MVCMTALAGCSSAQAPIEAKTEAAAQTAAEEKDEAATQAQEEHKPVTITLYSDSATNGANEAKVEAFEELYPWITVEVVEMPAGSSDRVRTLSTVLQAKDDSMDAF